MQTRVTTRCLLTTFAAFNLESALLCSSGLVNGLPVPQDRLVCLFAITPDTPANPVATAVRQQMDQSCTLPSAEEGSPPRIVLGSLDLTIGVLLREKAASGGMPEFYLAKLH